LLVECERRAAAADAFVLAALQARLPVVLVVNKIDRDDAPGGSDQRGLRAFLDLDADESQIDFPIVYANARLDSRPPPASSRRP
jgi:GTP-binding protein